MLAVHRLREGASFPSVWTGTFGAILWDIIPDVFSERRESRVSECLYESLPRHRLQSLPLQPLLQDLATDPLSVPAVHVLNGVHSTPQFIVEEENSECGVVCPNSLRNFETK